MPTEEPTLIARNVRPMRRRRVVSARADKGREEAMVRVEGLIRRSTAIAQIRALRENSVCGHIRRSSGDGTAMVVNGIVSVNDGNRRAIIDIVRTGGSG